MLRNVVLVIAFMVAVLSTASDLCAQLLIVPPARLSPDNFFDAEGVSIVINPSNSSQIAAGSNVNYYYFSTDLGHSWQANALNPTFGDGGDPSLTSDSKGNFYYAHLSSEVNGVGYNQDRIVIQKSTDGGKTYSPGTFTGHDRSPKQQFKEWITCDNSSSTPYKDNLYLSWTEFDSYQSHFPQFDSTRILFSGSTDAGETWSDAVTVSDKEGDTIDSTNSVNGSRCITGPNGEIYVTWEGPDGLLFDKSTDGGKSFTKDKLLEQLVPGWRFDIKGIYRANGFATPLCDNGNSKHRGNLYVLFSDKRNGPDDCDIFLLRSTNGGDSWSSPVRVNDDTSHLEQFFPSAAIDETTGFIYAVFYDRRDHKGTNLTEVYLARSIDGGRVFKISDYIQLLSIQTTRFTSVIILISLPIIH